MDLRDRPWSLASSIRLLATALCLLAANAVWTRPTYDATEITGSVHVRSEAGGQSIPVAGATVSNDWDATTAITDQSGHFRMRVRPIAGDEVVVVSVQAGNVRQRHSLIGGARLGPVNILMPVSP